MPKDLRSARLSAQLLHRPPGPGVGGMVRHLLAVQAQDVPSALLAFRARSATVTVKEIEAAWQAREIVRAWGPRGTLHFVHRDDLSWLLALTRDDTGTLRRLAQEGVTGDDLLPLIDRALAGQGPLTKAQLEARLGGRARGQGIVHLVALAAFHGLAVLGPLDRGKPTYVHTADWLGAPIAFEPDRDRALAELALRYLRAHAPAAPADLAAWSGLPLGAARSAFDLIAPSLEAAPLGGVRLRTRSHPYHQPTEEPEPPPSDHQPKGEIDRAPAGHQPWGIAVGEFDPVPAGRQPAGSAASGFAGGRGGSGGQAVGGVRLAPAFDEYLLGWADRDLILDPRHRRAVFPGGGILRPVMLADGVIEGTWSRKGQEVTLAPFEPDDLSRWKGEVADVRAFLSGRPRP
ncbi:winged helix DNA-binding domain-containing protein [Nonomuraea sp. NPDC059194]|uniref:winged helix DNA-binding domain-containing protein n=1 Tax=Nonomuraea sp. NPDC059194 TaxID=3346764 RepID=UPI00369330A2